MDIQKIIQVIADLFASKKRGDAPSSMLNQVLTATRETRDDGGYSGSVVVRCRLTRFDTDSESRNLEVKP